MDTAAEYLLSFLLDEFKDRPEVRVRLIQPSGTRRSVDLEQDYDPEASDIHLKDGVEVRAGSREYYFPSSWVRSGNFREVQRLASEIRGSLES